MKEDLPSADNLIEMSNNGEFGKLLVHRFGGQRGRTYPREDSEFLIVYENEDKVPSAEQVSKLITEQCERLGYEVQKSDLTGKDLWTCTIIVPYDNRVVMNVVVTVPYPFTGRDIALRMTTELI